VTRRSGRGRAPTTRTVVGLHPVRELLRSGSTVHEVRVADSRDRSVVLDEILSLADAAGVEVSTVGRDELERDAEGLVHQGVVARAPVFGYADLDAVLARAEAADEAPLLVALDQVTDPHNLGSIARTAEAVGAHGLVVAERRAAGVTPVAEKAAAGALAHLPVIRVTNLVRTLEELKSRHVWVVGLDADTDTGVHDAALLDEAVVLVVGSEGRGLARLTRESCDLLVRLPMRGHVGSLNASVAAAVALYEVRRRRDAAGR
jgi:23S rRNA (guanosine2251-2'-O)-methyltransferase